MINRVIYIIDRKGVIRFAKRGTPEFSEVSAIAEEIAAEGVSVEKN